MQPDILANVLGGLTEAIVGAFLGFVFAYLLFKVRRTRKVVQYRVMSTRLLPYLPAEEPILSLSIDKYALTGDEVDSGEQVSARNAHAFEIELLNAGNEPIMKPLVEVRLDERATVVQGWTDPPSRQGYEVERERDDTETNVTRFSVPFINPKGILTVGLTSVGNQSSACRVQVIGPGVETRSIGVYRTMWNAVAKPSLIYLLISGFFVAIPYTLRKGWLSSSFGAAIGAQVAAKAAATVDIQMPWWWYALYLLSAVLLISWFALAAARELTVARYGFTAKRISSSRLLRRIIRTAS